MPLTGNRVVIKGEKISCMDDFYNELALQLLLPDHFGRNLDALWDTLTADVSGPLEIVWENTAVSGKALGDKFEQLMKLLQDIEEERPDITVKFV